MDRSKYRAINKPRQCGISTTEAFECAWEFDNVPGSVIVIVSKDKDAAENFHKYIYNFLYSVRKNWKNAPKLVKTNQRETTNSIGSRIISLSASRETGRSFSGTHLVFDEMAHAEYADDIFQASTPTLAQTNGRLTVISTPKGRANLFYRIFENPQKMGFSVHNYGWWDVPSYNEFHAQYEKAKNKNEKKKWIEKAREGKWYKQQRPRFTELAWKQEFEGAFDANEGTVFTTRQIEKTFIRNYLEEKEHPQGVVEQWFTSDKKNHDFYATGIDFGRKNDPTVIITYDYENFPATLVDFKYIPAGYADWDLIIKLVKDHLEYWGGEAMHDGTGAGDPASDSLDGISEPFIFTKTNKQNIIASKQHAMDSGQVRMPKIPVLFQEYQRYIWDDKNIVQDCVMADVLANELFYENNSVYIGVDKSINYLENVSV